MKQDERKGFNADSRNNIELKAIFYVLTSQGSHLIILLPISQETTHTGTPLPSFHLGFKSG